MNRQSNMFAKFHLRQKAAAVFCLVFLSNIFVSNFVQSNGRLNAQDQTKDKKEEEKEIPAVETIELTSKDSMELKCSWYGGIHGKETVPVIMLHDWDGSREDLAVYAENIQKKYGYAVIVPDLRGHGESMRFQGSTEDLDRAKWKPAEIASIIVDIEACKSFLTEKNNKGELNIDQLAVVAQGKTCIQALQWSINDWQFGPLGGIKQGKDVKSLVMMAPVKSFRGLNLTQTIKHPLFTGEAESSLSMMVLGDKDNSDKELRESKSIYTTLERMRKPKKYLYYFEYMTKAQVQVVESEKEDAELAEIISYFIDNESKRFTDDFRWQDRTRN